MIEGVPPAASMRDFEAVLATVYGDDRAFVHPDCVFLQRVLGGRAEFLRHGSAQPFVVRDEGRPAAFAVAFVDPRLQERTGLLVGSIGFLEAVSQDACGAVLGAACEWLSSKGVDEVWTPFNGNPFFGVGLREDRFDEPPFLGCGYQPSTFCSWLEVAGFRRLTGYANFEVDLTDDAWRAPSADVAGVTFRPVSRARFRDEVARLVTMHNEAFRGVWGESEVSIEEGRELMGRARLAITPSLIQFAVSDGDDVGFVLCLPNINEVIAPHHRLLTSPSGIAKMVVRRRRVRTVGLLAVGVNPTLHGRGIGTALVARACRAARDLGYSRLEYALVVESNEASKSTIARFGGKLCRRFGVYAKELSHG